MIMFKSGYGQTETLSLEEDWEIKQYQGTCYHDTIIHAIWLHIEPNQELLKYQNDTSFIVAEVTAVNKSPIDIYFYGIDDKLTASIMKEIHVPDSARMKDIFAGYRAYHNMSDEMKEKIPGLKNDILVGTPPTKLVKKSAFEMGDYSKNPHKELWSNENRNSLILIPKGTRKKLIVTIPKREENYLIQAIVESNKGRYTIDCDGQKVSAYNEEIIESNKIELKRIRKNEHYRQHCAIGHAQQKLGTPHVQYHCNQSKK